MTIPIGRVALLWRGDREARRARVPQTGRLRPIVEALAARNIEAQPVVYSDEWADEIRPELVGVDGVLVWVDPICDGHNRAKLDTILRVIASRGVWVSTHPDIILKMGVKEVLYRTKHIGWGTDTYLYSSVESLRAEFSHRLRAGEPRVLKRNRGNGGQGVWKVERASPAESVDMVRVLEGRRGSVPTTLTLSGFLTLCEDYVREDGCVIDQPFQPRLTDGMIRCYMSGNRVVGYGHQFIKALIPPPAGDPDSPGAQPGPRIMYSKSAPEFRSLGAVMESEWTPQMAATLQIRRDQLPMIWDADFLYGPKTDSADDTYVLCEINVSSVLPIPDQAPEEIARSVETRLKLRPTDQVLR